MLPKCFAVQCPWCHGSGTRCAALAQNVAPAQPQIDVNFEALAPLEAEGGALREVCGQRMDLFVAPAAAWLVFRLGLLRLLHVSHVRIAPYACVGRAGATGFPTR
jgi:hypothetical protein